MTLSCVAALSGCKEPELAGDPIGTFEVRGSLLETSCAEGHPAPPLLTFRVELRAEPGYSYGYWKLPDGPLIGGVLDREGMFRFEHRARVPAVPADAETGVLGCVLERRETVAGQLEDEAAIDDGGVGQEAASFTGTTTIAVSPIAGGDCTPLLLPFGGAFPELPCQLRYDLAGQRIE
jgi:hypothetical protein